MENNGQIKPMSCPVCDEFYFTKLDDDELKEGTKPGDQFCNVCGWHYDLEQTNSPDLKGGANAMSLNEYKAWFAEKRKENPTFDYLESICVKIPYKCPVCGEYTFKYHISYGVCPICGWEDDGSDDEPDVAQGANGVSLNEAKKLFAEKRKQDPKYRRYPKKR